MKRVAYRIDDFLGRGTVKLAPDLIVRINGNVESTILFPKENRGKFSEGIRTVNITNNVDPPGSSTASVEIVAPIHQGLHAYYWRNPSEGVMANKAEAKTIYPTREPVFTPMMAIEIFFKGRFLVKNAPAYYQAFWGFINTVEESYSGGMYTISLQCVDMLHWWSFVKVNMHPTPFTNLAVAGGQTMAAEATIFKYKDPFTIMHHLTKSLGMDQWVSPEILGKITPASTITGNASFVRLNVQGIIDYWQRRFKLFENNLRLYGATGQIINIGDSDAVNKTKAKESEQVDAEQAAEAQFQELTAELGKVETAINTNKDIPKYQIDKDFLKGFAIFFDIAAMGDFTESEYMSKLDIATVLKNRMDYEFFQDVTGEFIFKPPYYNMNVKNIYPYVIEAHDITNASFAVDPDSIITSMEIHGSLHPRIRAISQKRVGWHFDIELAKKYGLRHEKKTIEWIWRDDICRIFAAAEMSRMNVRAYTGTLTIPGRPELRLGYPIYLPYRDSFHYVSSISHAFDFGGSFTTTLSLTGERKRVYEPDNPQTNGPPSLQKRKVYKFRGISPEENQIYSVETLKWLRSKPKGYNITPVGTYFKADQEEERQKGITETSIPFTDEEGYRVVGGFPYGRGIILENKDGGIKATVSQKNRPDPEVYKVTGATVESREMTDLIESQEGVNKVSQDTGSSTGTANSVATKTPKRTFTVNSLSADPVRSITFMGSQLKEATEDK